MKPLYVLAVALVAAAPLSAQSLNGSWITEFDRQVRNQNGEVSAGDRAKARITLQQKGDSVFGTFEVVPAAGQAASPMRQVRGSVKGDKGTLVSEFEARRNINGEEETVKIATVYDFTISGDKLEGTTTIKTPDMDIPPRPFSATREKP